MRMFFNLPARLLRSLFVTGALCCLLSPSLALASICCKCNDTTAPGITCLTDDSAPNCASIKTKYSDHKVLSTVTCQELGTGENCQLVSAGGSSICQAGPTPIMNYGTSSSVISTITAPQLNVQIPNLVFANNITISKDKPVAAIPFLAQYISAVYNYLIGIVVFVAAIMIIFGGFKYILGSTLGDIQSGKKTVTDAIIGLVLVFSSYTIIAVLNPAAVNFSGLNVPVIQTIPFVMTPPEPFSGGSGATGGSGRYQLSDTDKSSMSPPYDALKIPTEASCKGTKVPQDLRDGAYALQQQTGVPGAIVLAQWALESTYGQNCIGPAGKKYNCFGIKCSNGSYAGMDTPMTNPAPNCISTCSLGRTTERVNGVVIPYWSCFQNFDTAAAGLASHANVVKKNGWEQYNGTPQSFAHFIDSKGYATAANYGDILISITQGQCLK